MGNCCCTTELKSSIALKFPHGKDGIQYSDKTKSFMPCDINHWIRSIYENLDAEEWILYNDDPKQAKCHSKGHCKGILAWNSKHISWMCHSVPKFPTFFSKNAISDIDKGELIYGQSFYHIILSYNKETLTSIVQQLYIMEANMYYKNTQMEFPKINLNFNTIVLSDTVTHMAKSPKYLFDIYDCIAQRYPCNWNIETWKRGHEIVKKNPKLKDISLLKYEHHEYSERQDHSKWCVSEQGFFGFGDLNRMTSQFERGGGEFICNDQDISNELRKLIKE